MKVFQQAEELHPQQYQPTKDLLFCQQVQLATLMFLSGLTCTSPDPDTMQFHKHGTALRPASQHKAYPHRLLDCTGLLTDGTQPE